MTAIAYRDGVIASDSEISFDSDIKMNGALKIGARDGFIFGLAGDNLPSLSEFERWFFETPRKRLGSFKFDAIVVGPDRKIQFWDQRGQMEPIDGEFFAIGSGRQACVAAMEMGASATQAVEVACKWAPNVSGPVLTRTL